MFHALRWLTVQQEVQYNRSVMMYKVFNSTVPTYLINAFKAKFKSPSHNLRSNVCSSQMFQVSLPRTESFKRSFLYSGATLWNNLPEVVKNAVTVNSFKLLCKKCILY